MRARLKKDLAITRNVHSPLPIHWEETREARCEKKVPEESILLDDLTDLSRWTADTIQFHAREQCYTQMEPNVAKIELSDENVYETCKHSVRFTSPTFLPGVPETATWRGGIMCIPRAYFHVDHENWEKYNRISFWVYSDMPGFHSICLRMQFHNDGEHPVPDKYDRKGHHNINLLDKQWFHVQVEIPELPRENVIGISFDYDMCGSEPSATKEACWYISDLRLERLKEEDLDHYSGWNVGGVKGRIAVSGSGYQTGSKKTAILSDPTVDCFQVREADTGRIVLEKAADVVTTINGEFRVLDFSEVSDEGEYYVSCAAGISHVFPIGDRIWEDSIWKTINFFLCERCGCNVPHKHYVCCRDRFVEHNGLKILANGGWHDAGDMSQNLSNSAEITVAMFTLANRVDDPELKERLIEEGRWGLEWMLKTRFGDGYRACQVGGSYWTDGIIGNGDDRVSEALNLPLDNFMAAGAEAWGYRMLKDEDPIYAEYALKCAKEDWKFAYRDRDTESLENSLAKHVDPARTTSRLVVFSSAVWSALDIYEVSGDEYFKDMAIELGSKILECQQQEILDLTIPFTGFFYRDETRTEIVHYNHRSHEGEPILALSRLARSFTDHKDWMKWYYGVVLYSEYYRKGTQYTAPYNNSPASIYNVAEIGETEEERKHFVLQQAAAGEEAVGDFLAQVKNGVELGKGYYFRRFPVWYSFRGNHSLTLSGGIASAQAAFARNDDELAELAQNQLEWIVGRNPFAESVMYGEGYDYCQEYAVLPGEMVGELGVGIETLDDRDEPYWPQVNTCTYKEVWVHNPLRYAWLCAFTYGPARVCGQYAPGTELCFENTRIGKAFPVKCDGSGCFAMELPAGPYKVHCGDIVKTMNFISAKEYTLTGAFAGYAIESSLDGDTLTVTVKTCGEGDVALDVRCENVALTGKTEGALGETFTFTGKIQDPKFPYLAVIIPNGSFDEKLEAVDRRWL